VLIPGIDLCLVVFSKRKTLLEQHQEKAAKGQGAAKEESLARKAWNRYGGGGARGGDCGVLR
jgi:hypothetical protein